MTDKRASDKDLKYVERLIKALGRKEDTSINEIKESADIDSMSEFLDVEPSDETPEEDEQAIRNALKSMPGGSTQDMFSIAESMLNVKDKSMRKGLTANEVLKKLLGICSIDNAPTKIRTKGNGHLIVDVRYSGDTITLELG